MQVAPQWLKPWATCTALGIAAAVGSRVREGGSPERLYKAQTDNTKPRQTIQNPSNNTKPQRDKDQKKFTRIATTVHLTYNVEYIM